MSAERPRLRALAQRAGIVPAFVGVGGRQQRTSDATREALLAAMGFDGSSEAAAAAALTALRADAARPALAPLRVVLAGSAAARVLELPSPAPPGGAARFELELCDEGGKTRRGRGIARVRGTSLRLPLPLLPLGYHELRLSLEWPGGGGELRQRLAVAPPRCTGVAERLGARRGFGLLAHLYTLRSRRDWGAGGLGELRRLVGIAGAEQADFVGIQPLHAVWHECGDASPYAPVSRLYRALLHLDVEAVPELRDTPEARERLRSDAFRRRLTVLRVARLMDPAGVATAKREVLELLHRRFAERHRGRGTARGRAYARYCAREGEALERFATFVALAEELAGRGVPRDAERWPEALRDPGGAAVERFRAERAEAVDFQRYVQFELDRQLGACAAAASRAGLALGLYHDLAVGSSGGGADPWSFPGVFATGATLGAPPDDFAAEGQDWGVPPVDPQRLRAAGFDYWIRMMRASFAHAGALRIDHAMGLLRLYWVPRGRSPAEGAYVRQPAAELLGLLALESHRQRAVVVAEDLGTVPPGFAALLARRGILSSRVLYFEQRAGSFRPARSWSRRALATPDTHDLAPLAGWAEGRDLELRHVAGALDDAGLAAARETRAREAAGLARRLAREGLLLPRAPLPGPPRLVAAVAAFLARTPSVLVGVPVEDLVGERDPVNLPGIPPERHPSWRRRLGVPLERLADTAGFRAALDALRGVRVSRSRAAARGGRRRGRGASPGRPRERRGRAPRARR
jgi:4-alpha-glucanotransferase